MQNACVLRMLTTVMMMIMVTTHKDDGCGKSVATAVIMVCVIHATRN